MKESINILYVTMNRLNDTLIVKTPNGEIIELGWHSGSGTVKQNIVKLVKAICTDANWTLKVFYS